MAPKTAKDMFVEQTFIDDRYPPIALKVVSEAKFELGLLQWLLPLPSSSSDSKVTVGMHAGFSKAGFITALALSVSAKVLMITDLSARSRHDDSGGGMRRHLHSVLLNDTSFRITSFIAPELVLALHREIALRCVHVVDLLSLPPGNRDIVQTIKSAFGARIELYDDTSLREAFQENLYDKQQQIILAQKAWLAYFVGDCPEVKTQLSAFPIIDSTVFSINELNILAKAMLGLTAYELAKPNSETIKSLGHADFSGNNVTFNQASYSKRFRKSSHQVYRTSLDGNVTLTGFLSTLNGRQAKLAISDLDGLSNPVIESITILGKADPSHAEKEIYITILYCLQRKTLLLNDPWMDMLFPSFASTDDDQTNPSSDHDSEASLTQENSDCWAPVSVDVDPWATAIPGRKILHYSLLSMQPTEKVAFEGNLNQSQSDAVEDMLNLNRQISIIKGPPGTGKTTVIAAFVANILSGSDKTVWIAAQNNVAVKNIGEKLLTARITDWVLLVSAEYLVGWHEHLYQKIPKANLLSSTNFNKVPRCRVILCTMAMLMHARVSTFSKTIPVQCLVVDEASQISMSSYIPIVSKFGKNLKKLCFIGDDKQLPPYASDSSDALNSVFENKALLNNFQVILLDIQYRMPPSIGQFISTQVYANELHSWSDHPVQTPKCCQFFNIENGKEEPDKDRSFRNPEEAIVVMKIAKHLTEMAKSFKIITPYDSQRDLLEHRLKETGLPWENTCFTVDSFQGNEDDYIIISVVRTISLGFLFDERRSNVMLSRAKKGMFICSKHSFLKSAGTRNTLLGKMADTWEGVEKGWITCGQSHPVLEEEIFVEY